MEEKKSGFALAKRSSLGLINFVANPQQSQDIFLINNTPIRDIFKDIVNIPIDDYVFHTKVFLEYDEDQAFIFITKQMIFFTQIFLDDKGNLKENTQVNDKLILFKVDYKKIYDTDVFTDENYGNSIKLEVIEGSEGTRHSEIKFDCLYFKESFIVHHLVMKYTRKSWQIFFESNLLNSYVSQCYQCHYFVKKINRFGTNQDRLLILTNKFMFNCTCVFKNFNYKVEKLKWADSIKSITKVTLIEKKNLEIKIFYDTKINKKEAADEKIKEKSKSSRGFLFKLVKDKNFFLGNLRRIFYNLTKTYLPIESTK